MLEEQFLSRRAIERLRDGLFDPIAVDRLTIEEKSVQTIFSQGLDALEKGLGEPLCICGPYGYGKSHTLLYLNHQALQKGYATSVISLDFREVPFHKFSIVYQTLMKNLLLPDGKTFIKAWKEDDNPRLLENLDEMPYRFQTILAALLGKKKVLTSKEKNLKKYRDYQLKEHERWLKEAFMGYDIPISNLKKALKYRDVKPKSSLLCRESMLYMQMVQSLGELLKKMGYKGLVLFFDEGESIAQMSLLCRAKSYVLLDLFFHKSPSLYPIFAFTEDLFDKVHNETYDKDIFLKNYAESWKHIHLIRLGEIPPEKWEILLKRLIELYGKAYQVTLPSDIQNILYPLLKTLEGQETRFKLKSLVSKLDIESQKILLHKTPSLQ